MFCVTDHCDVASKEARAVPVPALIRELGVSQVGVQFSVAHKGKPAPVALCRRPPCTASKVNPGTAAHFQRVLEAQKAILLLFAIIISQHTT